MTGKDVFKTWTVAGAKWTDWVRPVPFIAIDDSVKISEICNFEIPRISYISELLVNTAVIIDIPDYESVKEGLALARIGFRPIPLYNGTNEQKGAMATVNNHAIESALVWGALELKELKIANNAPPAFLLDSNRTHRFKMNVSVFDNSWDLYDQDIPSAEYFLKNGIDSIIVRGESIQKDIARILYKFQKKGIKIFSTNGYAKPKEVTIKKPPRN